MSHQDYILKMLGLEDKNIIFPEKITESLASTQCMNRWDEGSWYTIPLDTEGSPS